MVFQVDEIEEKLGLLVQMYEEDRQSRLQAAAAAQAAAVLVTANNHRQPPGGGAPRGGGGPPPPPPAPSGLITHVSTVYSVTAPHKKNIKPTTTLQSKMNGIKQNIMALLQSAGELDVIRLSLPTDKEAGLVLDLFWQVTILPKALVFC